MPREAKDLATVVGRLSVLTGHHGDGVTSVVVLKLLGSVSERRGAPLCSSSKHDVCYQKEGSDGESYDPEFGAAYDVEVCIPQVK